MGVKAKIKDMISWYRNYLIIAGVVLLMLLAAFIPEKIADAATSKPDYWLYLEVNDGTTVPHLPVAPVEDGVIQVDFTDLYRTGEYMDSYGYIRDGWWWLPKGSYGYHSIDQMIAPKTDTPPAAEHDAGEDTGGAASGSGADVDYSVVGWFPTPELSPYAFNPTKRVKNVTYQADGNKAVVRSVKSKKSISIAKRIRIWRGWCRVTKVTAKFPKKVKTITIKADLTSVKKYSFINLRKATIKIKCKHSKRVKHLIKASGLDSSVKVVVV